MRIVILIISDPDKNYLNLSSLIKKIIKPWKCIMNSKTILLFGYIHQVLQVTKGTLHMHKSLVATANYAKQILKINKHDICFSAAKLFFAYGLGNAPISMSVGNISSVR